ncbi:MAG: fibronectin type III domain-containing protein, partial [Ginsengibacter sp.]
IADANSKIWYFYPSLNVNANNDMLIGCSASSSTMFAGAQYALHLSSDPVNTVQTPVQFVNGLAGYYKTYGGGRNRWGDYSGTAFDPVDNSFWTFQEWPNTGNNWGTQIAHIPVTGAPVCNTPTDEATSSITNTTATFGWTAVSGATGYNIQYRVVGSPTWTPKTSATNSYSATVLAAGTNYEWQVQTICSGSTTSSFSASTNFTTTGGCSVPTGLAVSSITTTTATVSWTAVSGATGYNLQYKASTDGSYTTISNLATTSYNLTGLTAGTTYQYQVQTICGGSSSAYSAPSSFQTSGGTITYCASKGTTTYEYINKVVLGSISNTSGNNSGYKDYTNLSTSLTAGNTYTITLTPGFASTKYAENWTVYIDYNQDGTLNSTGETVLEVRSTKTGTATGSFKVPATAKNGSTRMRIQMHYGSYSTNPCA